MSARREESRKWKELGGSSAERVCAKGGKERKGAPRLLIVFTSSTTDPWSFDT